MKMISTRTHGIIDYATVGTLLAIPRLMGWGGGLSAFLTGAALGTAAYSMMTDYEYGPVKELPMKTHLQLDLMNGVGFLAAALLFRRSGAVATGFLAGVGMMEIAVSRMTSERPSYYYRARSFVESIGDAIATATDSIRDRMPV